MTFWTTVALAVSATLVSVEVRINPNDAVNVVLNSIVMTVSETLEGYQTFDLKIPSIFLPGHLMDKIGLHLDD